MSNGVFPAASVLLHISSSFPRVDAFSIKDLTTSTLPPSHAAKKGVAPLLVVLKRSVPFFEGSRFEGVGMPGALRVRRVSGTSANEPNLLHACSLREINQGVPSFCFNRKYGGTLEQYSHCKTNGARIAESPSSRLKYDVQMKSTDDRERGVVGVVGYRACVQKIRQGLAGMSIFELATRTRG